MEYSLSKIPLKNYLTASSSPLTESVERLKCCCDAGFSSAILKSTASYVRTGLGHGRKIVYVEDGYYADASFEREILTLEEGVKLYNDAQEIISSKMLLIPSVCAFSLDASDWLEVCKEFESCGALLIQLDFFYLGNLIHNDEFWLKLQLLLTTLIKNLKCAIMPKINLQFDPNKACKVFSESGITTVSLLDSIREDPDERLGLNKGTTSYFGYRQFPYTLKYLKVAKSYGLEVCAGGGVTSKDDVDKLLLNGADMVQIASYVLTKNYSAIKNLLTDEFLCQVEASVITHNPWCDCENGAKCDKCGGCSILSHC